MPNDPQFELEELGLLPGEAQVYLALIRNGPLVASAIAHLTEIPRSSVYPTLNSLLDKGLIEGGAGYGSRFKAIPADRGLPALIRREREHLSHRESIVDGLAKHLASIAEPAENIPEELIEIIRSPQAAADRFERLELETENNMASFVKPPFFIAAAKRASNPVLEKLLRRGVKVRAVYEKAALEDPAIKPHLSKWVAMGEEARVYHGELPHKLQIFDSKIVLLPLIRPGEPTKTLLVRHPQLAQGLTLAFEHLWERSKPVTISSSDAQIPSNRKSSGRRAHGCISANSSAVAPQET